MTVTTGGRTFARLGLRGDASSSPRASAIVCSSLLLTSSTSQPNSLGEDLRGVGVERRVDVDVAHPHRQELHQQLGRLEAHPLGHRLERDVALDANDLLVRAHLLRGDHRGLAAADRARCGAPPGAAGAAPIIGRPGCWPGRARRGARSGRPSCPRAGRTGRAGACSAASTPTPCAAALGAGIGTPGRPRPVLDAGLRRGRGGACTGACFGRRRRRRGRRRRRRGSQDDRGRRRSGRRRRREPRPRAEAAAAGSATSHGRGGRGGDGVVGRPFGAGADGGDGSTASGIGSAGGTLGRGLQTRGRSCAPRATGSRPLSAGSRRRMAVLVHRMRAGVVTSSSACAGARRRRGRRQRGRRGHVGQGGCGARPWRSRGA